MARTSLSLFASFFLDMLSGRLSICTYCLISDRFFGLRTASLIDWPCVAARKIDMKSREKDVAGDVVLLVQYWYWFPELEVVCTYCLINANIPSSTVTNVHTSSFIIVFRSVLNVCVRGRVTDVCVLCCLSSTSAHILSAHTVVDSTLPQNNLGLASSLNFHMHALQSRDIAY